MKSSKVALFLANELKEVFLGAAYGVSEWFKRGLGPLLLFCACVVVAIFYYLGNHTYVAVNLSTGETVEARIPDEDGDIGNTLLLRPGWNNEDCETVWIKEDCKCNPEAEQFVLKELTSMW